MSKATFTFGRFNVPTEEGHGKLISAVQSHADETGGSHYVFPSHSQDAKKNPLAHGEKVGFMRRLFPKANIVSNPGIRTAIDAVKHLESKGHTHVTMVVGSDRVAEFQGLLTKYRKKEFPGVKKVSVVSAGNRDPDAEGAEGMSASKLRGLVAAGKRSEFISHYSDPKLGAQIHDRTKAGMQLESTNPVCLVLLGGPGSGKDYVLNNIFSRFDLTEVQVDHVLNGAADELIEQRKNIVVNGAIDEEKIGEISALLEGYEIDTVYVSVSNKVSRLRNSLRENPLAENKRIDKWLKVEKLAESLDQKFTFNNSINLNESSDLEKVFFANQIEKLLARLIEHGLVMKEEPKLQTFTLIREKKFPAVRKKHGMPAKYSAGLSKSTALARKRHWEKANELPDSDPRAYEPAPGDATAKTKPSKHTIAVRKMMGEQIEGNLKIPHTVESIADKHGVSQAQIIQALAMGKQVEMEHTKDEKTAETIALAHLNEKPDYYTQLAKMEQFTGDIQDKLAHYTGPENARKLGRTRRISHFRDAHRYEREGHKAATTSEEYIDEGKADKSLAAKAEKSGVSLSTLRKVFRRGVAAWNSGHRPGTTPSQWGHARVNSYINKGKTYHTADKDLREETDDDLNVLFERQLLGTDEYRIHAIAMTPGQNQEIENAYEVLAKDTSEKECECDDTDNSGDCDCVKEEANVGRNTRNFREFRASIKEAKGEVELPPTADVTPTLTKKRKGSNTITTPNRLVNPAVDGLPVVSRLTGESFELKEAVEYHLENKISFTENVFRPGSDMFFEMINEAKRLYAEGQYTPADEWEADMLNSDIGEKAIYEGQEVILDYPFEEDMEQIDEVFNTVYPHTYHGTLRPEDPKSENGPEHLYTFRIPGKGNLQHTYSVSINRFQGKKGSLSFGYHGKQPADFVPVGKYGDKKYFEAGEHEITGEGGGKASSIISTVKSIAQKHAKKHGLKTMVFAGSSDEPSRSKLYNRIVNRMGGKEHRSEDDEFDPYREYSIPMKEDSDPTGGKGVGKPWREGGGGAVYVRDGDSIRKIRFSQSGMKKKFMDPGATRSFVARHRCLTNKDKTSASYWACRWPRFFSNSGKVWW